MPLSQDRGNRLQPPQSPLASPSSVPQPDLHHATRPHYSQRRSPTEPYPPPRSPSNLMHVERGDGGPVRHNRHVRRVASRPTINTSQSFDSIRTHATHFQRRPSFPASSRSYTDSRQMSSSVVPVLHRPHPPALPLRGSSYIRPQTPQARTMLERVYSPLSTHP